MDPSKPMHKRELIVKDLGEEFLIYSPNEKELHVINPTARLIWNLCDGEHTIQEIEAELRTVFVIPDDRNLKADIQDTLDTFKDKRLLILE